MVLTWFPWMGRYPRMKLFLWVEIHCCFGRMGDIPTGWHEAAKDATVILKPHLKPRLSPRGKENLELQRQLEEQRGLMHKIKRKQEGGGVNRMGGC